MYICHTEHICEYIMLIKLSIGVIYMYVHVLSISIYVIRICTKRCIYVTLNIYVYMYMSY